jgi:hypothetical protein
MAEKEHLDDDEFDDPKTRMSSGSCGPSLGTEVRGVVADDR